MHLNPRFLPTSCADHYLKTCFATACTASLFGPLQGFFTIQNIIHIILNALHLRNWRARHQSLLFEVLEQFLGNSILFESFVESFSPGKTFVRNLHLSGVVGLRSTNRYPYGLRTASSYSLINQAVSLGYDLFY